MDIQLDKFVSIWNHSSRLNHVVVKFVLFSIFLDKVRINIKTNIEKW